MGLLRYAPRRLREHVGAARYFGWSKYPRIWYHGRRYRNEYQRLHPSPPLDQVFLQPDLAFKVPEASRQSFEAFAFAQTLAIEEITCFSNLVRGRTRFYDVGAETGCFSLVFTRRTGGSSLAWEPARLQVETKLQPTLDLNPGLNVEIFPVACGPEDGHIEMVMEGIHLRAAADTTEAAAGTRIPVRSIDSVVAERNLPPDTIKIDIEGFELGALQGARECLSQHKPLVFIEIHPLQLRQRAQSPADVLRVLEDLGYRIFNMQSKRLSDPAGFVGKEITRLYATHHQN